MNNYKSLNWRFYLNLYCVVVAAHHSFAQISVLVRSSSVRVVDVIRPNCIQTWAACEQTDADLIHYSAPHLGAVSITKKLNGNIIISSLLIWCKLNGMHFNYMILNQWYYFPTHVTWLEKASSDSLIGKAYTVLYFFRCWYKNVHACRTCRGEAIL